MAYTPPSGDAVPVAFASGYTPQNGDAVLIAFGSAAYAGATAQGQSTTGTLSLTYTLTSSTAQGQTLEGTLEVAAGTLYFDLETAQGQSSSGTLVLTLGLTGATAQGQAHTGTLALTLAASGSTAQGQATAGNIWPLYAYRFEGLSAGMGLPWAVAQGFDDAPAVGWQRPTPADAQGLPAWDAPTPADAGLELAWQRPERADARPALVWSAFVRADASVALPWYRPDPADQRPALPWGLGVPQDAGATLPWVECTPTDVEAHLPWGEGIALDVGMVLPLTPGQGADADSRLPWGAGEPPVDRYVPTPGTPPQPPAPAACYQPPYGDAVRLRFYTGYTPPSGDAVPVRFVCDVRIFRILRSLRVNHSLLVVRLPDRLPLQVTAVSLALDRDSWAWTVSVTFADRDSLLAVAPSPEGVTSIEITLDGFVWTALVESYDDQRALARKGLSATGRSRCAVLAAPYDAQRAYINPAPTTAQQLVERELEFSGFAVDWRIEDWPVPAGAFAYSRETHLGAVLSIAAASGAVVQAARDSDTLIVMPRHPVAPWEVAGATPDVIVEAGSCLNLGKRYAPGPGYQGVFVSGRDQGVLVRVVREGTAGSPYAELIVDPLTTDTVPAIARGRSVIAGATTREEITLVLPMTYADPGLLEVGELLEVEDTTWGTYRAVVTAVAIDAEVTSDGTLTARQVIAVERYLA